MKVTGRLPIALIGTAVLIALPMAHAVDPPITTISIAPDQKYFVTGTQAGVAVHSTADHTVQRTISADLDHVFQARFNKDGNQLALVGGDPAEFGIAEVFSWPDSKRLLRFDDHDDVVMDVAFCADGKFLATASMDSTAKLVEIDSGEIQQTFRGHSKGLASIVYLPKQEFIVTASLDHSIRVWKLQSGELVRTFNNHVQPVVSLSLRPEADSTVLPMVASSGEDRTVRFWQPTIGRMVRFVRLPSIAQTLDWTPDGSLLVAACRDGKLRLIDPATLHVTEITISQSSDWLYAIAVLRSTNQIIVGSRSGQIFQCNLIDDKP